MVYKKLLYIFVFFVHATWGQQKADNTTIKITNAHTTYINHCTNHLAAMRIALIDFNIDINQYVEKPKWRPELSFDSIYPEYRSRQRLIKTPTDLYDEFVEISVLKENLNSKNKIVLDTFFNTYQKVFQEIINDFETIQEFSKTLGAKPKKGKIEKVYELLESFKNKITELTVLNDTYSFLKKNKLGNEDLPSALQYSKNIIESCKQIMQSIRAKDTIQLKKLKKEHEQLML